VLQKTGNIAAVMSTMGHSDVKTAMVYQQPQMNIVREAINAQGISGHVLVRRPEIGITAKRDHPAILSSAVPDASFERPANLYRRCPTLLPSFNGRMDLDTFYRARAALLEPESDLR
jgi:hypothetical protein